MIPCTAQAMRDKFPVLLFWHSYPHTPSSFPPHSFAGSREVTELRVGRGGWSLSPSPSMPQHILGRCSELLIPHNQCLLYFSQNILPALTMLELICLFFCPLTQLGKIFLLCVTTRLAFHHLGELSVVSNVETSLVLWLNIIYRRINSASPSTFPFRGRPS